MKTTANQQKSNVCTDRVKTVTTESLKSCVSKIRISARNIFHRYLVAAKVFDCNFGSMQQRFGCSSSRKQAYISCRCLRCTAGSNPSRLSTATVQTRRCWFLADEHPRRTLASGQFRSAGQSDTHVRGSQRTCREASTPQGRFPWVSNLQPSHYCTPVLLFTRTETRKRLQGGGGIVIPLRGFARVRHLGDLVEAVSQWIQ